MKLSRRAANLSATYRHCGRLFIDGRRGKRRSGPNPTRVDDSPLTANVYTTQAILIKRGTK